MVGCDVDKTFTFDPLETDIKYKQCGHLLRFCVFRLANIILKYTIYMKRMKFLWKRRINARSKV